jgi:hypothetical protein
VRSNNRHDIPKSSHDRLHSPASPVRKPDSTHQDIDKLDKDRETPKAPAAEAGPSQVSAVQNNETQPFKPY